MLAERLATSTGKIGLVSIHLKTISETQANPTLIKLFNRVTQRKNASIPKEHVTSEGASTEA
jgi:hypothetical protein